MASVRFTPPTKAGLWKLYPTEYRAWDNMKSRCYRRSKSTKLWFRYGGRGIRVCKRWRTNFYNFLCDMGPKPSLQHSLDRIDGDYHYCPDNCRWATAKEQARNTSQNRMITFNGLTLCMTEWAERTGIARKNIDARLSLGWSVRRTLTTTTAKYPKNRLPAGQSVKYLKRMARQQ